MTINMLYEITAAELEKWTETKESANMLPVLIRRLTGKRGNRPFVE